MNERHWIDFLWGMFVGICFGTGFTLMIIAWRELSKVIKHLNPPK